MLHSFGVPVVLPLLLLLPLHSQEREAARDNLRLRFLALEGRWRQVVDADPARCGTGELVDRKAAERVVDEFLAGDPIRIDAWFELALDPASLEPRDAARRWAVETFAIGTARVQGAASPEDPAFREFHARKDLLTELTGRILSAGDAVTSGEGISPPCHLLSLIGAWEAIPVLLATPDSSRRLRTEEIAHALETISGRAPRPDAEGAMLSAFQRLSSFEAWWKETAPPSPAHALLAAARSRELSRSRTGAWHTARAFLQPEGRAAVTDAALAGLLESRWPPMISMLPEDTRNAPMLASWFSEVRDAAFLALFARDASAATDAMARGIRKNPGIVGQWMPPDAAGYWGDKARVFGPFLTPALKARLEEKVRDSGLPFLERFQWMVLLDQFFRPEKGVWAVMGLHPLPSLDPRRRERAFEVPLFRAGADGSCETESRRLDEKGLEAFLESRTRR